MNSIIQEVLREIARLHVAALLNTSTVRDERLNGLMKTLIESGFVRQTSKPLRDLVEDQVVEELGHLNSQRRSQLAGWLSNLQRDFDDQCRWESSQPQNEQAPEAANLRTAESSIQRS